MHDDHSSPQEIVSQKAIYVNGKILRCVQCDEPIRDLEYAMAAHPGYDPSERICAGVHEWCADQFHEEHVAKHRRRPWWYMASASELLYDPATLPFLTPYPRGSSYAQYQRLQTLRGER
jgi:hypothetical protein